MNVSTRPSAELFEKPGRFQLRLVRCLCLSIAALSIATTTYGQVVINEVIAANSTQQPFDVEGGSPDMVELYNPTETLVVLGTADPADSYYLSDREDFSLADAWKFPDGTTLEPGGFLVIFCDGDETNDCELHSNFRISNDGNEPVSLFGPEDDSGLGLRDTIDRVFLPPLREDVSFGRFPDGAGPSPVTIAQTLEVFNYFLPENTSFGSCVQLPELIDCGLPNDGKFVRECLGAPNNTPDSLAPRVTRENLATIDNNPPATVPTELLVKITDDADPIPGNITVAEIRYAVNGVEQAAIPMVFNGLLPRAPDRPLEVEALWQGAIPGQLAGAQVEFHFFVEDAEGFAVTNPSTLCDPGQGPCNRIGEPGENCVRDPADDLYFLRCDVRYRYQTQYVPQGDLADLVINEIVPSQGGVLEDPSEVGTPCIVGGVDSGTECHFDDFIELYNGSGSEIDLGGMWLSNRRLEPQRWQFPEGARILAGEYLVIWTDNDGGMCPRPDSGFTDIDGQTCPDPTHELTREYHTSFNLDADEDQIYLYDTEENGFGVVHSHEFQNQLRDRSLALTPDGCRVGSYQIRGPESITPGSANPSTVICPDGPPTEVFKRGDTNNDCGVDIGDAVQILNVLFDGAGFPSCPDAHDSNDDGMGDISDAVYILNYLFEGGDAPPAPGVDVQGPDPTPDSLGTCLGQRDCSPAS